MANSSATLDSASATPWLAITGVIATVSVFAIAQGLTYPLLSFILQRQGVSPSLIGLSAAMTPLGFLLSSAFIPSLARRFGAGRLALTCAALAVLLLALIGWTQSLLPWFPLRFLLGAIVNPLYVLSEVWMIALAPPARRGRIMGIYTSVISAGFAAGPLSLLLVGSEGWPPFLVGIGAFAVCGICLASVLHRLPVVDQSGEGASVLRFLPLAVLLLSAVFVIAGFEQALLALLPVYGTANGIAEATMSGILAVNIAGNIALQIPLGLLAERYTARTMLFVCVAATCVGCVLLPFVIGSWIVYPMMFIWGATAYGIYTMSLIELGERFTGALLIAGNAAFSFVWGVGGIFIAPATGVAMDVIGPGGLPLMLGLVCLALGVAILLRRRPARLA